MEKEKILLEVLRKGILEIRLLSSSNGPCSDPRINRISDILHNIPRGLEEINSFDFEQLKKELKKYDQEYESVGDWISQSVQNL